MVFRSIDQVRLKRHPDQYPNVTLSMLRSAGSLFMQKVTKNLLFYVKILLLFAGSGANLLHSTQFLHTAKVIALEDLNHSVKRVRLRLQSENNFSFAPGQFIFIKVPHGYVTKWNKRYSTNHSTIVRPYSIASAPHQLPYLDLIIGHQRNPPGKTVPPGLASTYIHTTLKVGDMLTFSSPHGNLMTMHDDDTETRSDPLILVAGGTGLAPFLSVLNHYFQTNQQRQIYLYLGVKSIRDLLLDETLSRWASTHEYFRYIPTLSKPAEGKSWQGRIGYVNTILDQDFNPPLIADVALAGSPIMIRETIRVLQEKGLPRHRIHYDEVPHSTATLP